LRDLRLVDTERRLRRLTDSGEFRTGIASRRDLSKVAIVP
jgi:hypothetical protein